MKNAKDKNRISYQGDVELSVHAPLPFPNPLKKTVENDVIYTSVINEANEFLIFAFVRNPRWRIDPEHPNAHDIHRSAPFKPN